MKTRKLISEIESLALQRNKMAFISGPRQVGKTTLAKMLMDKKGGHYFNWDELEFRRMLTKSPREATLDLSVDENLILDEIHKASKWKLNLKGIYDNLDKMLQEVQD